VLLQGKPLLQHKIEHLVQSGIEKIVINTHYLADKITDFITSYHTDCEIILSHEPELLDTGGGLKKALPYFDATQPVIVTNSDALFVEKKPHIIADLAEEMDFNGVDMVLATIPLKNAIGYDGAGDFYSKTGNGFLEKNTQNHNMAHNIAHNMVFGGLQLINLAILEQAPDTIFSLSQTIERERQNRNLIGCCYRDKWLHIGDVETLKLAEATFSG